MEAITEGLRRFSKEAGVPIIELSQLTRFTERRKPVLKDLKESGSIEADCHVALLLYAPMDADNVPTGEDEIIVAKQRNGAIGPLPMEFKRSLLRYQSREATVKPPKEKKGKKAEEKEGQIAMEEAF